jgi:hypothetical protein
LSKLPWLPVAGKIPERLVTSAGHIKILDRQKLEETVCECYRVVKDEFDRLLG